MRVALREAAPLSPRILGRLGDWTEGTRPRGGTKREPKAGIVPAL